MKLVIDTSVLIDHLRGDPRATALLTGAVYSRDELWSSTIVRMEVLAAVDESDGRLAEPLLNQLRWLPVTAEVACAAAGLARRHPLGATADLLVAASVLVLDARLVTVNGDRYPMLGGVITAY